MWRLKRVDQPSGPMSTASPFAAPVATSVRILRRSFRVSLLHRRANQRGDVALKRFSVVVFAAAVLAAPARGAEPAPAMKLRLMNGTPGGTATISAADLDIMTITAGFTCRH
jgi:hypothetical protein